ncbi:hypothetical protein BU24DRAFT_111233 [Aaosphaeria arxii CBS 175.79]|uniref:Uncharacterized protein n=1 Tax=Aaosphaeria arxii CBS 175.79 TaxID=1450172 RepID=A0A6A5Y1G8_9PLEO|nr:uncharacterized protein BU24DRAFT_111233 [Aaosphaeria arxii CBS 175.79]KAF2019043.1 hypothetical protein BU24DRAFT_111233 [Aaosphaeria arxii CBS 175.79]
MCICKYRELGILSTSPLQYPTYVEPLNTQSHEPYRYTTSIDSSQSALPVYTCTHIHPYMKTNTQNKQYFPSCFFPFPGIPYLTAFIFFCCSSLKRDMRFRSYLWAVWVGVVTGVKTSINLVSYRGLPPNNIIIKNLFFAPAGTFR